MDTLKRSPFLRGAVESLYVQVAFHVIGGAGLGLLAAQVVPPSLAVVLALLFLGAAILGHWYAVWSDPGGTVR